MRSPGNISAVPAGEPVQMMSPGSRVIEAVRNSMISGIDMIIWSELESCLVSVTPFWVRCALMGRFS